MLPTQSVRAHQHAWPKRHLALLLSIRPAASALPVPVLAPGDATVQEQSVMPMSAKLQRSSGGVSEALVRDVAQRLMRDKRPCKWHSSCRAIPARKLAARTFR